jgi:hypothetical protein
MEKDRIFKDIEGKTIKDVYRRENGCLIITFTDGTYTGIYNKGEFTEDSFELGINIYKIK